MTPHHRSLPGTTPALACVLLWACICMNAGCAPGARLSFPSQPLAWQLDGTNHQASVRTLLYDTDHDHHTDFAVRGRWPDVTLSYDDDADGQPDRLYPLMTGHPHGPSMPHVIIMLDSIPWRLVHERYERGDWPWFSRPSVHLPPFPNMSELVFGRILHAPPRQGMVQRYFDPIRNRRMSLFSRQVWGHKIPMERLLDYHIEFKDSGLSFLQPRAWFAAELARAYETVNENPRPVSLVYLLSSAGMVCKYGRPGAEEVLDGLTQLCLQLLHQRQGHLRISVLADHGHTFIQPRLVDMKKRVKQAGFNPTDRLRGLRDVVIDQGGLVNFVGLHTKQPDELAMRMAAGEDVQFVAHLQGDHLQLADAHGTAIIRHREGRFHYEVVTSDVLGYAPLRERMATLADDEGFIAEADWLRLTLESEYPHGPPRLWESFHGLVVHPPDVMVVLQPEACAGVGAFAHFITMKSTHGSLHRNSSLSFVMTTTQPLPEVVLSREILPLLEPDKTWPDIRH